MVVATIAASSASVSTETFCNIGERCKVETENGIVAAELREISLEGARLAIGSADVEEPTWRAGDWHVMEVENVGRIPGEVTHLAKEPGRGMEAEIRFHLPPSATRDALVRRLFAMGLEKKMERRSAIGITVTMLLKTLRRDLLPRRGAKGFTSQPPRWIEANLAQSHGTV